MTELLENSDNTNADIGVSESPANEAAISLTAVQALADALQKIESYTPTAWVDNESPDIDAAHLNKAEQAIMRVTTAMNSAVDVIKDLQSQVNTTNNNLSNPDRINLNVLIEKTSLNSPERTGVYYVTGDNIGALPSGFSNYGILLCMRSPYSLHPTNSNCVYVQEYTDVYGKHASRSFNNGAWTNWTTTATKDDLLISVSGTGPTDWTALETTGNMPFKIWNVTKASTSKGAPAGCYEYGTLIALVATATGDRWRNTLIYIPDSNSDSKIYIRNGRATKWLAFSGTKVDSVS